ncbi:CIN2 (YPL241C) [Zygosaccharomyces parabailii]|nr:CIN2 (YPL241C) [Zygosaccharomyces parabailii]
MSQEFVERRDNLLREVQAGQDTCLLKEHAHHLQNLLNHIAPELAPYDLQRYSKDINEILKLLDVKAPIAVKSFQFKIKPKFERKERATQTAPVNDYKLPTKNQVIYLRGLSAVYENLQGCVLENDYSIGLTGSLTLKTLVSCTINLREIPFDEGSIMMVDCSACSILLHAGMNTQIRLHNLQNCKILIRPVKGLRQIVVMENCHNTIFHESCRPSITVQEFDNLALTKEKNAKKNYQFQAFDWPWQEDSLLHT